MPRTAPKPSDLLELYIDESSQTNHRYFALGSLAINHTHIDELERRIVSARIPELPSAEMGWKKVSKAKLEAYRRVVDVLFDRRLETQPMHFHAMIVDSSKLKDNVFNGGSREVGFNKEVYQLCQRMARLYRWRLFHTYLDSRTTKSTTEDLRFILNSGLRKKGDTRDWPFRRVHFRDSAASLPLQLCDILLGAVMYQVNDHISAPDASPAKCDLSRYVVQRLGFTSVHSDSPYSGRFTLWHRRLR